MDFKTFVQNAVASYISKKSKSALFIKHYNTIDINKDDILAQVDLPENGICLYHEYASHEMHSSFDPFFSWIKDIYNIYYKNKMSVEDFLYKCKVYPVHIELLAKLIRFDMCSRTEDVLYFEIEYETERMLKNLVSIIDCVSKEYPLILIISKLHLAPYSTMSLLKSIIDKSPGVQMIFMYNDEFIINEYKKSVWSDLLKTADDNDLQLEWGSLDSEKTIEMQDEFWFEKKYTNEYYTKLQNMFYTFSLEDAYYYIQNIMSRIEQKTLRLVKSNYVRFLMLAADIDMTIGKADMALVMCDKLTDLQCGKEENLQLRYDYYYTYARARMFAEQADYVKKYCEKCVDTAKEIGSEFLEFRAEILTYIMESTMGHDLFEYQFNFFCTDEIVKKAKKHGFWNFLSYIYVFGFDNDPQSLHDIALGEKEAHYFDLAIEIGKKLGNNNFLLNAYMKNTIQYSEAGYHSFVRDVYKQRLIVLGRPKPVSEAHMLAGLGYNGVILEDYEKAHFYLCKSVINLANIEQAADMQPMDIMNSLYNLALIHLVAENYAGVVKTISLISNMLKMMEYRSIRACSNIKLYTFMVISCYYLEDYYSSYCYLRKIEAIADHMVLYLQKRNDGNWDEDIVLYHLVKGIMYNFENNYELCLSEFNCVKESMNKVYGSLFFIMPVYSMELSSMYYKQGMFKEAEAAINEGIQFCEKENLPKKKERLIYYRDHHTRLAQPLMEKADTFPLDKVLHAARSVGKKLKLAKRDKEIQFLNVLLDVISRENMTVDELFLNTSTLIKNSYNLDDIIILRRKNDKREFMIENDVCVLSNADFDDIIEFFRKYSQPFLSNCTDEKFLQFKPVMKYFSKTPIATIVGIPIIEEENIENVLIGVIRVDRKIVSSHSWLNNDDLQIIKTAFVQFCNMLRWIDNRSMIEQMSEKLEQSAVTDQLTGISNRIGFSQQEEIICSQENAESNVLLYCDLDNFKYYNDTFGHDVGDMVLVNFAKIIKKIADSHGMAVRYGGDEFIVLLYNNTQDEGVEFAQRIYEELGSGFVDEIKVKLNKDIVIPSEKKISCSIGITEFKGGSKLEFKLALDRADRMLYYVKKHGKSTYKLYDPTVPED